MLQEKLQLRVTKFRLTQILQGWFIKVNYQCLDKTKNKNYEAKSSQREDCLVGGADDLKWVAGGKKNPQKKQSQPVEGYVGIWLWAKFWGWVWVAGRVDKQRQGEKKTHSSLWDLTPASTEAQVPLWLEINWLFVLQYLSLLQKDNHVEASTFQTWQLQNKYVQLWPQSYFIDKITHLPFSM